MPYDWIEQIQAQQWVGPGWNRSTRGAAHWWTRTLPTAVVPTLPRQGRPLRLTGHHFGRWVRPVRERLLWHDGPSGRHRGGTALAPEGNCRKAIPGSGAQALQLFK
jgi:hypothetical protein